MVKRLVLIVVLLFAAVRAQAVEFTDAYYNPSEPGWGVFLVQSDTTQFLAFFIYDVKEKPIWYTAQIVDDGTGNYTGTLYAITGTYFANPWQGYHINPAGTASFKPTDTYHATLKYTVNGVPTVTKTVQRQSLTPYVLAGNYSGSMSGAITGCADPSGNDPSFRARFALAVTQIADQSAALTFTFVDTDHTGIVCTVSGPLTHLGRLYQLAGQTNCGTNPQPATIDGLHPTGQGIEGHLTGDLGGGCKGSLHFSAVLNVNH